MIDRFIEQAKIEAPAPEPDEADTSDIHAECASYITFIDLKDQDISAIIWSTGFNGDFSYLKLAVFNKEGALMHKEGLSEIERLYFVGLPWLRKRKSDLICGIEEDAEFISQNIKDSVKAGNKTSLSAEPAGSPKN